MSASPNLLELVAGILAVVFPFWPIVVGGALISRLRQPLWPMLVMWIVMLICWLCARLTSLTPLMHLIPEPLSTVLFFAAGVLIVGLFVFGWGFKLAYGYLTGGLPQH